MSDDVLSQYLRAARAGLDAIEATQLPAVREAARLFADAILAELGMGRAHHRVLHFVGRHPGITVGDLLGILGITKQSLGRVLTPLVEQGYVLQAPGRSDRRQRLLSLTPKGVELERRLFERQREWLMRAYREAGPVAVEGFRRVMRGLMGPEARTQFDALERIPAQAAPAFLRSA